MAQFKQGEIVKFKEKAKIYDTENNLSFYVPTGTTATVLFDHDVGAVGACKIRLKKADGTFVVAEVDDKFLEKTK